MKLNIIAILTAACCVFISCSMDIAPDDMTDVAYPGIEGSVTDEDSNPISHLKVTITYEGLNEPNTVYTSSKGLFHSFIDTQVCSFPLTIEITIEDIDGGDNGGMFETLTDRITILEESDLETTVSPTYRLTRATPSENIPQS